MSPDDEILEQIEQGEVLSKMFAFLSDTRNGLIKLGWTKRGAERAATEIWTTSIMTIEMEEEDD